MAPLDSPNNDVGHLEVAVAEIEPHVASIPHLLALAVPRLAFRWRGRDTSIASAGGEQAADAIFQQSRPHHETKESTSPWPARYRALPTWTRSTLVRGAR